MITKQKYVDSLVSTPINYTCSNLAEHLAGTSHDVVSNCFKRERLTSRHLWELVEGLLDDSPDAYLIIDDSVQDKRHSRSIEKVQRQYSGAEGGLAPGIGVVNLVHTSGEDGGYSPIDYRIYAKEADGKSKNDHFQEMLLRAVSDKRIQAKTVLFDSWYGSWQNLKLVHRLGLTFYTTLKANRLVSLSAEAGYIHLDALDWSEERLKHGILVKLKKLPFKVKLLKLVATNIDTDWVITNDPDETVITQVAQNANELRCRRRRISPRIEATDWRSQMPMSQSSFSAQSLRLLLSCLALTQGPRYLVQQNHLFEGRAIANFQNSCESSLKR